MLRWLPYAMFMSLSASGGVWAGDSSVPMPSPYISFLQMLLALGVVLVAIAAMAWLVRRFSPGQTSVSGGLRVVGAVAVGPKERVVLVDVGDTRLVLGVAAGQVTCLKEMPRPEGEPVQALSTPPEFLVKLTEHLKARKTHHEA